MAINCATCEECLWIDICCVYDYTPLNSTLGEKAIKVALRLAQELKIGSYALIGEKCYTAICVACDSESGLSEQQQLIVEKATRALAWWTYYFWLVHYGGGQNLEGGRKSDQAGNMRQIDSKQHIKDIGRVEKIAESYTLRFKAWLDCQELECDTCEETCVKCDTCDKCGSGCGCKDNCCCEGGPYIKKASTYNDIGSPNKLTSFDSWDVV